MELVTKIIDLSKSGTLHTQLSCADFSLKDMVYRVVSELREEASDKNVRLDIVCDSSCDIYANEESMESLITNLLENAISYNKDGGFVQVIVRETPQYIKISVSDTGLGISGNHIKHLGQRFYRIPNPVSYRKEGSGLGLSIVKQIASLYSGRVNINSIERCGTTVSCFFPAADLKCYKDTL